MSKIEVDDITVATSFRAALRALCGLPVLGSVAGSGTGTVVSLHLGRAIPLRRPSNNKHLSEVLRTHQGEYSLFIKCTWRLDTEHEVLCGAYDDNSAGAHMLTGLAHLTGAEIVDVRLLEGPARDLELAFTDMTLRIFCDNVQDEEDDNYVLFMPDATYVIGPRGALTVKPRDPH